MKHNVIITQYDPRYAEQTVKMWRDSKERAIGQKEKHSFMILVEMIEDLAFRQINIEHLLRQKLHLLIAVVVLV